MLGSIIIGLFYLIIASSVIFGIATLIRSNLYDIRQGKWLNEQARHPNARHLRRRPLVSILVFADNDAETIIDCLKSVVSSSYRKTEAIVIDNASSDGTKRLIQDFIRDNPKKSLRLVAKRRPSSRGEAIAGGYKRANGELVLIIDGSCVADKEALKNAVHLMAEPAVDAVLPNMRLEHNYRLFGLSDKSRTMAAIWSKKSGSWIGPSQDSYNYSTLYRRELLAKIIKPKNRAGLNNLNYMRGLSSGDVYASRSVIKAYKTGVSGRGLLAVLEPVLACWMLYVAIKFHNPGYLLLGWVSFTSLLLLAIWSDDSQDLIAKGRASLLAVVAYSLYILQSVSALARRLPRRA